MTSAGKVLRYHFGALALFQRIYEYGLEFEGKAVTLDFIRRTPLTSEEHFHQVRQKEFTSLCRMCKKVVDECRTSNDNVRAPILQANDVPTMPIVVEDVTSFSRLQISRPEVFGALMRKIFGSHTSFRILSDQGLVDVNTYLPETLQAFPVENPDLFTRVKKTFIFSRPAVSILRRQLAALWDDHGLFPAGALASMMSVHTRDEPHLYNIVITGTHLIGLHNNPFLNLKLVDWLLSKHVLISGYDDDVRFAGEAWMEHRDDGLLLHLTKNSGTYQPKDEHLARAGQFIAAALPGLNVELHSTNSFSTENHFTIIIWKNILLAVTALILIFCFCFLLFCDRVNTFLHFYSDLLIGGIRINYDPRRKRPEDGRIRIPEKVNLSHRSRNTDFHVVTLFNVSSVGIELEGPHPILILFAFLLLSFR